MKLVAGIVFCLFTRIVCAFRRQVVSPSSDPVESDDVCANYKQKHDWFIRFADAFMSPNNTVQANSVNSTLFSQDVQGRVDLTNTFDGRELNTEVPLSLSD